MLPTPPYHVGPPAAYQISQQQTTPLAGTSNQLAPGGSTPLPSASSQKRTYTRIIAAIIAIGLAIALYFIWRSPTTTPPAPSITQQNVSTSPFTTNATSTTTNPSTNDASTIQVYIVGAVKHPGVYTLPVSARVYQLLRMAGGPLPNANLVALNMAARLNDGQEVYVPVIGETPPTSSGGVPGPGTSSPTGSGQLVNINTATVDEMHQTLHISARTAQKIIDYRTQHGNYTSVDQLLQVVSKATYSKIKDQVTV